MGSPTVTSDSDTGVVRRALKDIFGFDRFLPNQAEIVAAILAREDAFVVMPTGGGKSLCYQLPAYIVDGTCLVISPLISLMKDQVDAALATGLRAAFLNSSLPAAGKRRVETALADGTLDLLYVSPERFAMPEFIDRLRHAGLAFVAIDEAHCISEWGHDFRPDYLNLATLTREFPDIPVTAFTATATRRVQDDIVARLGLRKPHIVRASFNRPNLHYKVIPKERPGEQILRFIKSHPGEAGIVYRTTRKNVEQTAEHLARHGIRALPYHAGLGDRTRTGNQEAFNRDQVSVIVATIAFGMGIDKSNVRYVLHGDLPKNVEGYYQETGRAGRDGEPAQCLMLFGYGDIPKMRYFIDAIEDDGERKRALRCLNDMVRYATLFACRRKQLLNYFGETYTVPTPDKNCCDICAGDVECVDITRDSQIVLSAIARTGNRFGINHIIAVVSGDDSPRLQQLGHDRIKTFGAGRDQGKRHWRWLIDNLLAQGLINQTDGDYPVLQLDASANEVLFENRPVAALKTQQLDGKAPKPKISVDGPYAETLFEELRDLRRTLAAAQGVPPYVVFTDRTLHEMARQFPVSESAMLAITGVGQHRLTRYGQPFMDRIRIFLNHHPQIQGTKTS